METTERIVEAYVRYIKNCATIPNLRCAGQYEIDLLAINPLTLDRYHIESGVSVSGVFSELTNKPFSTQDLRVRVKAPGQRRTLGYFVTRKFGEPSVKATLASNGFEDGNYHKVIVTWGWSKDVEEQAAAEGVELWDFRQVLAELSKSFEDRRSYFTDDTLRTLHLFARAAQVLKSKPRREVAVP